MTNISEVRYARSRDGIDIAYQVVGDGPVDLVFVSGFVSHLDLNWEHSFYNWPPHFDGVARVIMFDKRGTGLSDRSLGFGSLADRTDDLRAVIDATGSHRVAIWGVSEGGPMALLFAATYPERVSALIIGASMVCGPLAPDSAFYPPSFDPERAIRWMERHWGTGAVMSLIVQHAPDPEWAARTLARFERNACTPQMVGEIMRRNFEIDIRTLLSAVSVPTLILHNAHDPLVPVAHGRFFAERISGARYIEGDGDFHASWLPDEMKWFTDAVCEFLGGAPKRVDSDRILATVLFTDIVSSTEHDMKLGDRAWRTLLDDHDRVARAEIDRHNGRLIKTTGDGLLATFDGPARAIRCAQNLREAVARFGIGVRAGLHTGEIELRGDDVAGMGVVIARRVCDLANTGEVLTSRTVKDLVTGSGIDFFDRGPHALKGVPDDWELYAVAP